MNKNPFFKRNCRLSMKPEYLAHQLFFRMTGYFRRVIFLLGRKLRDRSRKQHRFRLKAIYTWVGLALLSFVFATSILPVRAQHLPASIVQRESDPATAIAEGRKLYQIGRFSEAVEAWKRSLSGYEAIDDRLNQALTLNYLSLAYQDLGEWERSRNAIARSLEILNSLTLNAQDSQLILAGALNTQGSLLLAMGDTQAALDSWKQAETAYARAGDETGKLGSQINQAQAMQTLGMYRRSQRLLDRVNEQLQSQPNSLLKAIGLRSLGIALQVVGNVSQSRDILAQSLAITQQFDRGTELSLTLLSLGNTARSLQEIDAALEYYQQAARTASQAIVKLEAQLNELHLLVDTQQWEKARSVLPEIQSQLNELSPSRLLVDARVNLAENLIKIVEHFSGIETQEIARLLATAVQEARELKDPRSESYAIGQLGYLYERTQQYSEARNLTLQALAIAETINASDIAARWQWQLGRIFKQQAETSNAIAAYTEAVNLLESLRTDLVAIDPDVQFSFTQSVEPVYRELVSLLLKYDSSQENLKLARQTLEQLQLAELENFFREACLQAQPQEIDKIDASAAVIYPIILPDRLAVIVSLPGESLRYYETNLSEAEVEKTLENLLESLNPFFSDEERLQISEQVYDWLIRPTETALAKNQIKTLVFVLDGLLRNLPMAALYDGQQYLVEKYSIAVTPGLQLLEPRAIARDRLSVLTAGLTEARQGFSALPGVESEVEAIASQVPSKVFLDREFTATNLERQIETTPFRVLHLATHGQFSSNPDETFILTWDNKIQVNEFQKLLRSRQAIEPTLIELLVLSACQTAAGDKRAALGLAGVAVRSGARSTLATLWSVKDRSTASLMADFYRKLTENSNTSKAEALRMAQIDLLKQPQYQHPFYWAPFILVGNWL